MADVENEVKQICKINLLTPSQCAPTIRCMSKPTLLDQVRRRLGVKTPKELAELAVAIGVNYATVLRIRDGKGDPAFGKVQSLAARLGIKS